MGTLCPSHTVSPCTITSSPSSPSSSWPPWPNPTLSPPSPPSPPTLTPAGTSLWVPARQTLTVWWTSTLISMTEECVSYCVTPEMAVTTSGGLNPVRSANSTLSSINTVTSSVEPGVLRLRTVSRERNQSRTSS